MIPLDAVLYSTNFWQESQCLIIARYAGMRLIERLTETESTLLNPVLGNFLGRVLNDPDDAQDKLSIIVGTRALIGDRFRSYIISSNITIIAADEVFPLLIDPEEGAPPTCPGIDGSGDDDQICPTEYECLSDADKLDFDPSTIRCRFEGVDEAACPGRPNFDVVLAKRNSLISSRQQQNRTIIRNHSSKFREQLRLPIKLQKDVHAYNWSIYAAMLECLCDSGISLNFKAVAKMLKDRGVRTKSNWVLTDDNLRKIVGSLGKTAEWRRRNTEVSFHNRLQSKSWKRKSGIEKLFSIFVEPLPPQRYVRDHDHPLPDADGD